MFGVQNLMEHLNWKQPTRDYEKASELLNFIQQTQEVIGPQHRLEAISSITDYQIQKNVSCNKCQKHGGITQKE